MGWSQVDVCHDNFALGADDDERVAGGKPGLSDSMPLRGREDLPLKAPLETMAPDPQSDEGRQETGLFGLESRTGRKAKVPGIFEGLTSIVFCLGQAMMRMRLVCRMGI